MFGKIAILFCCAGIVMCKKIQSERNQNAPRQVSSASASSLQPIGIPTFQYPIPLEARILQTQQPGNLYSPDIYTTQNNLAQYAGNSGAYEYFASPSSTFAIRPNAVTITSASVAEPIPNPVLAPQPIQYNQQYVERPTIQYLPRSEPTPVVVKEDRPEKNSDHTQKYEATHQPTRPDANPQSPIQSELNRPAVQYVTAPTPYPVSPYIFNAPQVYYDQTNSLYNNPYAIPVTYNTAGAIRPQYFTVPNYSQSAPGISYQTPVSFPQQIAVPPYPQNQVPISYKVPSPVVYNRPSDHSSGDLRATRPIPYNGYSRALKYSPAPAVSSVNFSGLGVNYGF